MMAVERDLEVQPSPTTPCQWDKRRAETHAASEAVSALRIRSGLPPVTERSAGAAVNPVGTPSCGAVGGFAGRRRASAIERIGLQVGVEAAGAEELADGRRAEAFGVRGAQRQIIEHAPAQAALERPRGRRSSSRKSAPARRGRTPCRSAGRPAAARATRHRLRSRRTARGGRAGTPPSRRRLCIESGMNSPASLRYSYPAAYANAPAGMSNSSPVRLAEARLELLLAAGHAYDAGSRRASPA